MPVRHTMITIYGIRNCDTVKKSLRWFDERQISYRFHDFKKNSLDPAILSDWLQQMGWQTLVNCKGTTWRKLALTPEMMDASAAGIILENQSLIRRPLVCFGLDRIAGYAPEMWAVSLCRPVGTDQV